MSSQPRRLLRFLPLLLLLLVAGNLLWRKQQGPLVPVVVASEQVLLQQVVASGEVRSDSLVRIGSELVGVVKSRAVREGDRVAAGDLLLELEDSEQQARVEEAAAALQQLTTVQRPQAAAALRDAEQTLQRAEAELARREALGQRELDERWVYLDLRQAQTLLNLPGGITVIDATVPELFEAENIAQQLGRRTGLKAESWMATNGELLNALRSQSLSTQMISIFVGISVAFGIASVLAISVVQRTREIGILRAMGSQRGQIQRVFLLQGALLGCGGSLLGAAIGWGLVQIFNNFGPQLFYVPVDPMLVPQAVLLSTLTGLVAAFTPARRAAHYDPAEAIRYV